MTALLIPSLGSFITRWQCLPVAVRWRVPGVLAILAFNQLWPALYVLAGFWLGYSTLALFGLWQAWPWLRFGILYLGAILSVLYLAKAWRSFSWPGLNQSLRMLEQRAGMMRGHLHLLQDRPANVPNDFGQALWLRAQQQAKESLPGLSLIWPKLRLAASDRFGLAPLLVLSFALGLFVAQGTRLERLRHAFDLWPQATTTIPIQLWITPPAYTGLSPRLVLLKSGERAQLSMPRASTLRFEIEGVTRTPRLDGIGDVNTTSQVQRIGQGAQKRFILNAKLQDSGRYRLRAGIFTLAHLEIDLSADRPPTLAFRERPIVTATQSLDIRYQARDDYGLVQVWLRVQKGSAREDILLPEPAYAPIAEAQAFRDLTPSAFAGERVSLRLIGVDGAGQRGMSQPLSMQLPERNFQDRVARQVIAVRKGLFRAQTQRRQPIMALDRIAQNWAEAGLELGVFAGLRAARHRIASLHYAQSSAEAAGLLWEVALAIEDRRQGAQLSELRQRFEALAQQIAKGKQGSDQARNQALREAAARLEQALAQHMAGLLRQALLQGSLTPQNLAQAQSTAQAIDPQTLQNLMQALQERLAAGDMQGAQTALQNLQAIMENLQIAPSGTTQAQAMAQAMAQTAQGLQALTKAQETLKGQSKEQQGQALKALGQNQQNLGQMLQTMRQTLQEKGTSSGDGNPMPGSVQRLNQSMAQAQQAMAQAARALGAGQQAQALQAQTQALQALGKAQAAARSASGPGSSPSARPGTGPAGTTSQPTGLDPLGRPGGSFGPARVDIPSLQERRAVEDIRRLLETKAADPNLTPQERAYFIRLLRRFDPSAPAF